MSLIGWYLKDSTFLTTDSVDTESRRLMSAFTLAEYRMTATLFRSGPMPPQRDLTMLTTRSFANSKFLSLIEVDSSSEEQEARKCFKIKKMAEMT